MLKGVAITLFALGLFLALAAGIVMGAKSLPVPVSYAEQQDCVRRAQSEHIAHPDCPKTETVWARGLADPVAFYTLWLTLFTLALAVGAAFQSGLIARQISLARAEFIATFRPKLVVRFVQGPVQSDPDEGTIAFVTFANVGSSDARIVSIGGCLAIREKGAWQPPGLSASPSPISEVRLPPGERHTITIHAVTGEQEEGVSFLWGYLNAINEDSPTGEICAVGEVQYLDKNGLRRQTGFIRVYDFRSQSWRADQESELEYCD